MPLAFLTALLLAAAPARPAPGAAQASRAGRQAVRDARDLAAWIDDYGRRGEPWLRETEGELRGLIRRLQAEAPEDPETVVPALLDLAAARTRAEAAGEASGSPDAGSGPPAGGERIGEGSARLRRLAVRALREAADPDPALRTWLASEVLVSGSQPARRRVAAARVVSGQAWREVRLALFTAARDGDRSVRQAASESLVGWRNESVHAFLAGQLLAWARDPEWIAPGPLERHFESAWIPDGGRAAAAITRDLEQGLAADDWRASARALRVLGAFEDRLAVPALLDALESWSHRPRGTAARRIAADLAAELERRSGRRIGPHPERWRTWWEAVRAGRLDASADERDGAATRAAGFFGLHPETDRVTFVLDRSGSMGTESAGGERTRHEAAVAELMGFLRGLGPEARFRLVVFNDGVHAWGDELRPATERELAAARGWLLQHGPQGGTRLEPAVRAALYADAAGRVDLERLLSDTVIVLCDGETEEGPGWVAPFLDEVRDRTCVRFFGVQIGSGGDGTLAQLAGATGGELVRVD